MRLALLTLVLTSPIFAQPGTCGGLTSVRDTAAPHYPAIAKAAHVEGIVILEATLSTEGHVEHLDALSGPKLLLGSAIDYVQGWQANTYTGSRTCPVVLRYILQKTGDKQVPLVLRTDPQHVTIYSGVPFVQALNLGQVTTLRILGR